MAAVSRGIEQYKSKLQSGDSSNSKLDDKDQGALFEETRKSMMAKMQNSKGKRSSFIRGSVTDRSHHRRYGKAFLIVLGSTSIVVPGSQPLSLFVRTSL